MNCAKRLTRAALLLVFGIGLFGATSFAFAAGENKTPALTPDTPGETDDSAEDFPVEVAGDKIEYLPNENKVVAHGNVIVAYKQMRLTCDRVEVLSEKKQAYAYGHVILYQGKDSFRGDEVFYDFRNQTGTFPDGRTIDIPWYSSGEQIEQVNQDRLEIQNGSITSCDLDRPHYSLDAKRLTVYLGDKVVARNVVFRVLGQPVFWWPYFILPLDNRQPPVEVSPGYSKEFGYYVLVSKGFSITKHVSGKWHTDWRSKRGFGGGVDLDYAFPGIWGSGEIKSYATHDKESPDPRMPNDGNPYSDLNLRESDRGRLTWKHKSELDPFTTLLISWHEVKDEFFLQDFFEKEHRQEISPETFINLTRNAKHYGIFAQVRKRSNRHDSVLERLPEVRFNWKTSELWDTGIYYQNEETFSSLVRTTSRGPDGPDVMRFDTYHQVNYPFKFQRIDFNPNVNWQGTYWSESSGDEEHITRQVWGGGLDVSTKFYRIFDVQGSFLGIRADKIRHLVEPSAVYSGKREVTRDNISIHQLDSTDSRSVTDTLVFGIENRIQTKREINGTVQRVDIVSHGTFFTYDLTHGRPGGEEWTTITQNLQLRPYDWFTYELETSWSAPQRRWLRGDQDLVINYRNVYLVFGHRYVIESSSLLTFNLDFWINERWAYGTYWRHELDNNRTEEYEFRLTRDLHDWFLDFGFNMRRNTDQDEDDYGFFFELMLKAFPERTLKSGSRATVARPRIGNTVSGAEHEMDIEKFRREGYRAEGDPLMISSP